MRTLTLLALATVSAAAFAQSPLAANPSTNNGSGGIFMQLTGINSVSITHFETFITGTTVGSANIEVWTRSGSYAGFTASNAGWTLNETVTVTANLSAQLSTIDVTDIAVGAGNVVSVYLHSVTTGRGIRYWGTGTTSVTNFSNSDLAMFTDTSRTGTVAFGGSQFTPRAFAGNVHYTTVPEPATMIALASGLAIAARRRRK